jgi:hypothetical protein
MYLRRPHLFLGIGLLFIPLGLVISGIQALVLGGFGLVGVDTTGESAGALVLLVVGIGTVLALLGLALVQAATAQAVVSIDQGDPIGPIHAYRIALRRIGALSAALVAAVVVCGLLSLTTALVPVAIWLAVRWILHTQVIALEDRSALGALRRSSALVRRRWLRIASLVGVSGVVALAAGPLVGALLIFATSAPLALLNIVAGVVYALAMPFVALVTTYAYVDARAREELEPKERPDVLPAEVDLSKA